jgi:hypothetical protein
LKARRRGREVKKVEREEIWKKKLANSNDAEAER